MTCLGTRIVLNRLTFWSADRGNPQQCIRNHQKKGKPNSTCSQNYKIFSNLTKSILNFALKSCIVFLIASKQLTIIQGGSSSNFTPVIMKKFQSIRILNKRVCIIIARLNLLNVLGGNHGDFMKSHAPRVRNWENTTIHDRKLGKSLAVLG